MADRPETNQQRGGRARAARLTPEQRSEIARHAAYCRWRKAHMPQVEANPNMLDGDMVLIHSGQWGAYWRADARGYTDQRGDAGRYTFKDARAYTDHAGPEKRVRIEPAPAWDRPGPTRMLDWLARALPFLSWMAGQEMGLEGVPEDTQDLMHEICSFLGSNDIPGQDTEEAILAATIRRLRGQETPP